mmetsp:Transcript_667/g.1395  ORF Transcript_667/g.1395 Transcript_667/m.1395 type:complete len:417 (+) Transcript_667:100-1350(+)
MHHTKTAMLPSNGSVALISGKPFKHRIFVRSNCRTSATMTPTEQGSIGVEGDGGRRGVRLMHASTWATSRVQYRLNQNEWRELPCTDTRSSAGRLREVFIETDGGDLEFVMTDGQGQFDKNQDGSNFQVSGSGVYSVNDGQLVARQGPRFMVVSDLDGTMVGDDATTLRFKTYWEEEAVWRGSVLVFSSGRTLEQYLELAAEKDGVIASPDALVSAVGTRVYTRLGQEQWEEDDAWTATLDEGWNEQVVLDSCTEAIELCGEDKMHFRPLHEMNAHKITCGIHVDVLEQAESCIQSTLDAANVKAKLIRSGQGDWRYLDIVPVGAGKLESLEYIRQQMGIPKERTVACGDSGNDIAMFEGENLSIVVGNAQPDLVAWLEQYTPTAPVLENGQARILHANAKVADGILEGLKHFGLY